MNQEDFYNILNAKIQDNVNSDPILFFRQFIQIAELHDKVLPLNERNRLLWNNFVRIGYVKYVLLQNEIKSLISSRDAFEELMNSGGNKVFTINREYMNAETKKVKSLEYILTNIPATYIYEFQKLELADLNLKLANYGDLHADVKLLTRKRELEDALRFSNNPVTISDQNSEKRKQLELKIRQLSTLKIQEAGFGSLSVPIHISIEIEDLEDEITQLKLQLGIK